MFTIPRSSVIVFITALSVQPGAARADQTADPIAAARAIFESAHMRMDVISPSEPRGIQPLAPAIPPPKQELATAEARARLRKALLGNGPPNGASSRQGLALAYLAIQPSADDVAQVEALLEKKQIWEPWRAALVIASSGDPRSLPTLRA